MLRVLAALQITRPHNMVAAALSFAVGQLVAGGTDTGAAVVGAILTGIITGAGNIINDIFDVDIDRVNKPKRPLPAGRIGVRAAAVLYVALSVISLVAAFVMLPPGVAVFMTGWVTALFLYAAKAKRVFLVGNLLVAAITSSAFAAGALLGGDAGASLVPCAIAFVFVFAREIVKGIEDLEGDRSAGVHTLAVVFGARRAGVAAAAAMIVLAAGIPWPWVNGQYGTAYMVLMGLFVIPALVIGAVGITRHATRRTAHRISWTLKFAMFFGIVAIALG